jgi:hypothetical protein
MRVATAAIVVLVAGCAAAPASTTSFETTGLDALPAAQALPGLAQKLLDALPGDKAIWERYVSADAVYVGEDGEVAGKKELLESFGPFPPGLSGSIKVRDPKITEFGDVAVMVFDAIEEETVFDQHILVSYFSTQVWRREAGHWRLVAAQSGVRAKDPPPSPISRSRLHEYAGTYVLGDWRYRVETNGETLVGTGNNGKHVPLIAVGDNVFVDQGNPLGMLRIFLKGPNGRVDRMVQRRKFADLIWKRIDNENGR